MDLTEYKVRAMRTDDSDISRFLGRVAIRRIMRVLHGAVGMSTEAGEVLDQVKKHVFYGKPLDRGKLVEELGDVMWYVMLCADALGVPLERVLELNVEKLEARYGGKFSEERALVRDVAAEKGVFLRGLGGDSGI